MALPQVCVVGGGIIGLTVAARLLEAFKDEIVLTIIADSYPPYTTASDVAGGAIVPPIVPKHVTWVKESIAKYSALYRHGAPGIVLSSGNYIRPKYAPGKGIWFRDLVSNFNGPFQSNENPRFVGKEMGHFNLLIVKVSKLAPWLMDKIKSMGGIFVKRKIDSLSELSSFDVVVNCTGLGARELAGDTNVYGSKGLVVRVSAPWIWEFLTEEGNHEGRAYIYPRIDDVVLGARDDAHQEDRMIYDDQVESIIDRCTDLMPSLKNAKVVGIEAGVRPMRNGDVRLEKDEETINGTTVIHNYGHGGFGISLSMGCAKEVGSIVGECLGLRPANWNQSNGPLFQSKL